MARNEGSTERRDDLLRLTEEGLRHRLDEDRADEPAESPYPPPPADVDVIGEPVEGNPDLAGWRSHVRSETDPSVYYGPDLQDGWRPTPARDLTEDASTTPDALRLADSAPLPKRGSTGRRHRKRAAAAPAVPAAPQHSDALTAETVLRSPKPAPQSGWRKTVLRLTGGKINLGPSPEDRRRADQLDRARTPIIGTHRVAVISLKGGVGKTTTTTALGSVFASLRGDRVIAVDANPDRGTLAERVRRESPATIRQLIQSRHEITRYGDVRSFTSQSPMRLEVLASDADPKVSSALSEQDYIDTVDTLERFYNLVLTDCGTGLLHDAMRGVLGLADSLVVVSSASLDGARSASATLDWLEAHGLEDLARNAVVVISSVRPGGGIVDVLQLEDHFSSRCREVVTIPYDPHLEAGGVMDIDALQPDTLEAYRELAAAVGAAFATSRH
jgi:MinD-like ATPase involved in chromosome partitioning or flagellar assembly